MNRQTKENELRKCRQLISNLESSNVSLSNIDRQLTNNKKIIKDILMLNDEIFSKIEYEKIITNIRKESRKIQGELLPTARRAYSEILAIVPEEEQ